jgi:serine/threonine-protein kinase
LLSQVARGRTGVIWRARSTLPGGGERLVKVLDPAAASRESALERFEAEASAIARIDHPNIVRLIDVSNANGLYFYVMEPVEGRTLEEHLTEGTLEPRDAIVICAQVARGLAVAHAQSVVHRDVAPASVIVTGEMVTKLFDFAFLKVQEEVPSLTDVGDVVGDYRFCAPEQAANPRSIDARADLYSVGAMLYYSLAGRPPIEGRSFLDTYKRLISEPPQPLQELVPDVRPKLAQVVARTLEKEPEKRYASGAELAAALDEALLDTLVAARTFAPPPGAGIGADFRGLELLEVLQVLAARHATGHLAVTSTTGDGLEGELLLRGGDVAAAKTTLTEAARAASAQLLDVRAGNFTFRSAPSVADRGESPLSAAQLALDALRRRR